MKNRKLKGKDFKDFFDVAQSPVISFKSTKIVQPGPYTFEVDGNFTIRGVTKPEKPTLTPSGKEAGSGTVAETLAVDRNDCKMNKGTPLVKIADRVEVTVNLKGRRLADLHWPSSDGPKECSWMIEAAAVVCPVCGSYRAFVPFPAEMILLKVACFAIPRGVAIRRARNGQVIRR